MRSSFPKNRVISSLFAVIFFSVPIGCNMNEAGSPSQFSSVDIMVEEFNDYSSIDGTFKVISQEPLHIQFSPQIVEGDYPDVIREMVDRSLVYGIYRTFIHTSVEEITVTSLPKEVINSKTWETRDVTEYQKTIRKSRKDALDLVNKHLGVTSFADLVTDVEVNDTPFSDQWIEDFGRLYYNDKGSPGLTQFVTELSQ